MPSGPTTARWHTKIPAEAPSPPASSVAVRDRFSRQPHRDTRPELALRREHRRGLRYRVDHTLRAAALPRRRADVLFPRLRLAVFVDGCFWHFCPLHAHLPAVNRDWWRAKLALTVARDRDTDAVLKTAGRTVLRVWEHEDAATATDRVGAAVRRLLNQRAGGTRPTATRPRVPPNSIGV